MRDEDKTKERLIQELAEVTEQVEAEQALKRSEARLLSIFRAAPVGIGLASNRVLLEVNDRICEMTGYSREELLGGNARILYPSDEDYDYVGREKYAQIRERGTGSVETRWERKDGTIIDVILSSTPIDPHDLSAGVTFTALDITERKRAEDALRESERRFREMLENVQLVAVMLNEQGHIIFCNDFLLELTGWGGEEILGRDWFDIFVPPELGVKQVFFESLAQGTIPAHYENDILTRQGERRLISWSNTLLRDPQGNIIGTTSIGEDITERKQAEAALRESEERYRHLFNSMLDGFALHEIICDEAGQPVDYRFLEVNPAFEKLTGLRADDTVGRTVLEVLPGTEAYWIDLYGRVALTGEPVHFENYHRELDKHFEVTAFSPKHRQFAVIFEEVTERVRVEAERERLLAQIREQARRMQQIMDTVPEGVLLLDADGCVVLANPLGRKDLEALADAKVGDTIGQLGGRPLAELLTAPPEGLWHEVAVGRRSLQVIARPIQTASAPPQGVAGTGEALAMHEEQSGGWVLVVRDVTQQREIERRVQQQERLAAVGQLAAGIAHDFNNLLTAINGFADLILLESSPGDPLGELAQKIIDSGQRAADLVRQLLAFSRKQIIRLQVLDLNTVVEDVQSMLRRIIGEDIQLTTTLAPGLWRVRVDPTQIEQVIVNLAINARDAMPGGGGLTIETANVILDEGYSASQMEVRPGDYVLLAISDTGVGMSQEVQARIFEPFFTTKEKGQGTGLGLASVYGIVKQSGGHIWVCSEEGGGTTFKIYLPRAGEVAAPSPRPDTGRGVPTGDETILLVEDNPEVRDLARRVLRAQGYTLLEAQNGQQALRLAAGHPGPIHLLLADVVMPGMSGRALAEQLTAAHLDLKLLFMSGYADEAIAHHGFLSANVAFLHKPFSPADLARKVRAALDMKG